MPMSCPVAVKIAAIALAGVKATDCMPEARPPPLRVPAHASVSRSLAVVRRTRVIDSSARTHSAITVFPWPRWKYWCDGFLSPPMFASRTALCGFTGARSIT